MAIPFCTACKEQFHTERSMLNHHCIVNVGTTPIVLTTLRKYRPKHQYKIALREMLEADGRHRGKHTAHRASLKTVEPSPDNGHWLVTGTKNKHAVRWQNGRFTCFGKHPDGHRAPGRMCAHELAVYRHVAHQYQTILFDKNGYRRPEPNGGRI